MVTIAPSAEHPLAPVVAILAVVAAAAEERASVVTAITLLLATTAATEEGATFTVAVVTAAAPPIRVLVARAVVLHAPAFRFLVAEPALDLVAGALEESTVLAAAPLIVASGTPIAMVVAAPPASVLIPIVSHCHSSKGFIPARAGVPGGWIWETSSASGLFRERKVNGR
jgi:hypothetical protein